MRFRTERQFIVNDDLGTPFIVAEVAGVEAVDLPPVVIEGDALPFDRIDERARAMAYNNERVLERAELEADPTLRMALKRWESGDDSPIAEYERQQVIAGCDYDDPHRSVHEVHVFDQRRQAAIDLGPPWGPGALNA